MLNWFLIIIAICITVLVLVANVYFLVYFQHEEDKNTAWFPKIVVVIGMTFSVLSVLLLPFDVANSRTEGGLDLPNLWQVIYMFMAGFIVAVVPFTVFYYEAMDEKSQLKSAVTMTFMTLIVAGLVIGLMYAFLGFADLPVEEMQSLLDIPTNVTLASRSCFSPTNNTLNLTCMSESTEIELRVSLVIYIIAMLAFLGWFLLVLFGSIGLAALPMDLINYYRNRPKRIELDEYARQKLRIHERAGRLIEIGRAYEQEVRTVTKRSRKQVKAFNQFKKNVYFLEEDYEKLKIAYKERGGNILKYWFSLFVGILGVSTSLLWIIHICVYVLPSEPADLFLNKMLIDLDNAFGLMGTLAYGAFALYFVWAIVKGNVKFGMRFAWFQIHPMKVGGTMMNSFVFNVGLIMLCSITVTQLCTMAFGDYARLTAIDSIFGTQARYLRFLRYFYKGYFYTIVVVFGVSLLYLLKFPGDKPKFEFSDS
eukprot:TRINITY_DN359_c0_g2_i2.p1 TRINITY_DN359_c0_g2~~TRINITY_DN359_c0_g2_i2.p1  ORF type:complete len:479 (-),score=124.77 TRINITY_DN359_c0_g2_i2:1308-2744(-)